MATADAGLMKLAAGIRLLVLDVDGVLTDGRLLYDAGGGTAKHFHVRDGYGLKQLMAAGVTVAVISGRASRAAATRLAELGLQHVVLGCNDKAAALDELLEATGISEAELACMGDDEPDLPMLRRAALALTVADCHHSVAAVATWRSGLPGGAGAVREACDMLLEARRHLRQATP